MNSDGQRVELISVTLSAEHLVASAARLCYSDSSIKDIMNNFTPTKTDKFVQLLKDLGHESPFEHVKFSFGIEGVSRVLTHQLVRHRMASYSQQSQRYINFSNFDYVVPPSIASIPKAKELFIQEMERDRQAYVDLVDALMEEYSKAYVKNNYPEEDIANGMYLKYVIKSKETDKKMRNWYSATQKKAMQDARYVLPNSCKAKIIATFNARSLFNFFYHRCCHRAQWEIRSVANQMLALAKEVAPNTFNETGKPCVVKGYCPENKMQCEEFRGKIITENNMRDMIKKHAKEYLQG